MVIHNLNFLIFAEKGEVMEPNLSPGEVLPDDGVIDEANDTSDKTHDDGKQSMGITEETNGNEKRNIALHALSDIDETLNQTVKSDEKLSNQSFKSNEKLLSQTDESNEKSSVQNFKSKPTKQTVEIDEQSTNLTVKPWSQNVKTDSHDENMARQTHANDSYREEQTFELEHGLVDKTHSEIDNEGGSSNNKSMKQEDQQEHEHQSGKVDMSSNSSSDSVSEETRKLNISDETIVNSNQF
jgi:hypothetical protein